MIHTDYKLFLIYFYFGKGEGQTIFSFFLVNLKISPLGRLFMVLIYRLNVYLKP